MRVGPFINKSLAALKVATESNYRWIMLGMMAVEIGLLVILVGLEAIEIIHRWTR